MDGANGQLKKITCEKNLEFEKKRKVICCKHSASRTAVEQAADTGPMFKIMKSVIKEMEIPNATVNHIYHHIDMELKRLQENNELILSSHKKKAILATIPKLPSATGKSHSLSNIRKGFVLNGQLDYDHKLVPSLTNILHTFRGNIKDTCLENKEWLINTFYEEMYTNGVVAKSSYNAYSIPKDRDMNGFTVERDFTISQENRQRAKILSSSAQVNERKRLLFQKQMVEYRKAQQLYDSETKDYVMNKRCKNKLVDIALKYYMAVNRSTQITSTVSPLLANMNRSFRDVCNGLTLDLIICNKSSILLHEAKAFVKVRSTAVVNRGRRTYKNIPLLKDDLLLRVFELLQHPVYPRYYRSPVQPVDSLTTSTNPMEDTIGDNVVHDGTVVHLDSQMDHDEDLGNSVSVDSMNAE